MQHEGAQRDRGDGGAASVATARQSVSRQVLASTTEHNSSDSAFATVGHVIRFRRSKPERIVRSRRPAHPEIVSVETFTQAQLRRRSRSAGGMREMARLERTRTIGTRPYLLRGLVRCGLCSRKMQGALIRKTDVYYRCLARTLTPGSEALAEHPRTVDLPEGDVVAALNTWIGELFRRENIDRTARRMPRRG
ncbi:recombinase zinc ribbon domain-containing protein [Amycolatopsis thermophila]|uniref:Recombinase zinc beta ribbon domain-containing protein n=1 Tax=Amycolatopsis thermophila TaxID=206084 RepID=A0ABU0F3G2_9PSEU|nr:zinc ribbon domain-containing protein [Amycolatopsis thermophila]MDQ0381577.1 hypothetical protein [Amycolatopsis thermophila]